jgi:hypothetical protein
VLNSTKVKQIVKGRHMKKIRNSCEYEPWANGAVERSWRTLTACAREFLLRGFKVDDYESDGEEFEASEYWTYAVQQAANAYNALRGSPDTKRRISHLRVPFLLPRLRQDAHPLKPYRDGKHAPQAEACMHLGYLIYLESAGEPQ